MSDRRDSFPRESKQNDFRHPDRDPASRSSVKRESDMDYDSSSRDKRRRDSYDDRDRDRDRDRDFRGGRDRDRDRDQDRPHDRDSSSRDFRPRDREPVPLKREDLLPRIRAQMEFYFSLPNLRRDTFLRAEINNDKYGCKYMFFFSFCDANSLANTLDVAISKLLTFNNMRALTKDPDDVVAALKDHSYLEVRFASFFHVLSWVRSLP